MPKAMYVYIMTNANDSTLYTGVTNDLRRRVYEHRHELVQGFKSDTTLRSLCTMRFPMIRNQRSHAKSRSKAARGKRRRD